MFGKRDFARSIRGKALAPSLRKDFVNRAVGKHAISVRKACELFQLSRCAYYYQAKVTNDGELKEALLQLAQRYPRYGYWKLYHLLRQQDWPVNHKKVYRLYHVLGLKMRRKTKKRLPERLKQTLTIAQQPNVYWSLDFMSDSLCSGRRFRTLNIMDDFNREALVIEIDTSLPAARVIRVLEQLKQARGLPRYLRVDNGAELTSNLLKEWTENNGITLLFIQPGKPTQNAYIERFNGSYRREVLNAYEFSSLSEARQITERWIREYNTERPHASLKYLSPNHYLQNYYAENSLR